MYQRTPTRAIQTRAVVVGASMAGLLAARVLSDHVDHVTILERDQLGDDVDARRGVPQGRHAHVLLAAGQHLLDGWFPGLTDELVDRGAVRVDAADLVWHQAGGYRAPTDLGALAVSMTRPLLEGTVRRRLLARRCNVTLADGVTVEGPIVRHGRVAGVRAGGRDHPADLVVDCSGRHTRLLDQLAEHGFPAPDVTAIQIDMAYGTRALERRHGDLDGALAVAVDNPERGHRMGVLVPVEGNRWILTVGGFHGDTPSTYPAAFAGFVGSLPGRDLAKVLHRATPLTPVMTHKMATSQRRRVECLRRPAAGYVVLGDAICSFNPIYGQGMTSAALQAAELDRVLTKFGLTAAELPRAFYRRAAKVVDVPWKIAAGADFADPRTPGRRPLGTDLTNAYLARAFRASHTSVAVSRQLVRVQNLLARPESLLTPLMAARVFWSARRSPAAPRPADRSRPRHVPATPRLEHYPIVR